MAVPGGRYGWLCLVENADELVRGFLQLRRGDLTSPIYDDARIGGEQPFRANPARLLQPAGHEVGVHQRDRISVTPQLTGDLAQNEVIAPERRQDECQPALRRA